MDLGKILRQKEIDIIDIARGLLGSWEEGRLELPYDPASLDDVMIELKCALELVGRPALSEVDHSPVI